MQWHKSWGDREGLSLQSFDWGTAVLTPPKFKLGRDSAGSFSVRSHKEYITYYNLKAVIVKFQFPLYTTCMTSGGSRGTRVPSLKHLKN